jgi:hypothetical protein
VKLDSRLSAESISSLSLFSAATTCAYMKRRVFPIWTASRSVGVGDEGLLEIASGAGLLEGGRALVGGEGGSASKSS